MGAVAAIRPAAGVTRYAKPEDLRAWRNRGGHPPTIIYAQGGAIDPEDPGVKLVNQWIAEGIAVSHNPRESEIELCWIVRLLPVVVAEPQPDRKPLTPGERRVLAVIREYAGELLPSNMKLAREARVRGPDAARRHLRDLERMGLVKRTPLPGGRRRVELLQEGTV